jgi:hypothetical protein
VLDPALARRLKDAGLRWHPEPGDAFAIPDRDLDGQVFWVSNLVVELRHPPSGEPILAFNGTTEWALDSLEAREAVWLPREDQLRDALGPAFAALERQGGELEGWVVVTTDGERYADVTPESALARAVLALACY